MSKVFPHVPENLYAVIVENKPRSILYAVGTSLEEARDVCHAIHSLFGNRRVIIRKFQASFVTGRRTWEPKRRPSR